MKKLTLILILMAVSYAGGAENITKLWSRYHEAVNNDKPQTALTVLHDIQQRSEKERSYGNLLYALLLEVRQQHEVSADSVTACRERLAARYEQWKKTNGVMAVMYQTAMTEGGSKGAPDIDSLLASPDAKAYTVAGGAVEYKPLLEIKDDSKYFNHDLLSVIGIFTKQEKALQRHYAAVGNRKAACLMAASTTGLTMEEADSIIALYQDLPECGEVAIKKMYLYTSKQNGEKLAWIDEATQRWAAWRNISVMTAERENMTRPEYRAVLSKKVMNTNHELEIIFKDVRNMNGVRVTISRMQKKGTADEWTVINGAKRDTRTKEIRFKQHNEYETWDDTLSAGRLPIGVWQVLLQDVDGKMPSTEARVHVTDLRVIEQTLPKQKRRYVVVNSITGQPVGDATLHLQQSRYGRRQESVKQSTFTTDEKGECVVAESEGITAYATKGDDVYMPATDLYGGYNCGSADFKREVTNLYTDRAIYRLGQEMHVAVICQSITQGKETEAVADKSVTLRLMNANGKEITKKTVTTDEYGTAAADFTLPEDGQNGQYSIRASTGTSVWFRVEEYKRPTYEVSLEKPSEAYKAGDTLMIKGTAKTYSGVPVANARVAYEVKRSIPWWWRYWYDGSDAVPSLKKDTVYTDETGAFEIQMPMLLPEDANTLKRFCFYSIEAVCDVTDQAGETHAATIALPVSNRSTFFGLRMPAEVLADTAVSIRFTRLNNTGKEVEGKIQVTLDGKPQKEAQANEPYALPQNMPSGKHLLTAVCEGDSVKQEFVVFRKSDKVPMTYTHDWWYQSAGQFEGKDQTAWMQVGTSDEDVYAVYSLFTAQTVLESGALRMNNSVYTRTFNYKEEYGDGVTYTIAWVKDDKLYTHTGSIRRLLPQKQLKMEWTTFRDRLIPGSKEQWTLNIKKPDGTPAKAQMMAVLYDKSLDAIVKHSWSMADHRQLFVPYAAWFSPEYGDTWMSSEMRYKDWTFNPLEYTTFADYQIAYAMDEMMFGRPMLMKQSRAIGVAAVAESKVMFNKMEAAQDAAGYETAEELDAGATANDDGGQSDGLRTNFDETAFFMPTLVSDEKGNVALRFQLPESVTTWRFMGLAHDKQMQSGLLYGEAIAQKQLMVQPRMPRFLRKGDKAEITATVANLSENTLEATVMMILSADTAKLDEREQSVSIPAGETRTVTYPVDASMLPTDGVVCRIMAEAEGHRDGEQHLLPVLSDEEVVVNTRTWTLFAQGKHDLSMEGLQTAHAAAPDTQANVKVRYTDTPAWMMVDALRDIVTPDGDNAISLSAAFYANAVTAAIKDSAMYAGAANTIARLKMLQRGDGSFPWWQGMPGSRYMTMAVAKTMARMMMLAKGSKAETTWRTAADEIFKGTMRYMQAEMAADVEQMKKDAKRGYKPVLSQTQLDWLYTLTISGTSGGADAEYLLRLVEKDTKKSDIATKATGAIVMNRNGQTKQARTFLESIKEHTVYREDMGRYFDSYRADYSWCNYRIPTHTMCIEAMNAVMPQDRQTITEMQRWLMNSKRTQHWQNPYVAVDAVHAFFGGDVTTLTAGVPAALSLDGKPLNTTVIDNRMGLVEADTACQNATTLTVDKQTEGESWVAAWVSSVQKTADVEEATTGLSVKREVLSPNKKIKVGDRIKVRITVKADRDYDFVTVTDNRAACLEPVNQLSGYSQGCYREIKDRQSVFHYHKLAKGTHVTEMEYYVERAGEYNAGTATAKCAYADEFRGTAQTYKLKVGDF